MNAYVLVVLVVLLLVAVSYVIVRVVVRRINRWADAMICSFGLQRLSDKQKDCKRTVPIIYVKPKSRFGIWGQIPLLRRPRATHSESLKS